MMTQEDRGSEAVSVAGRGWLDIGAGPGDPELWNLFFSVDIGVEPGVEPCHLQN